MMKKGVDSGIGVLVPVGQKLPNLQKEIDDAVAVKSDGLRPLIPLLSLPKNSEFRRPTFRKLPSAGAGLCDDHPNGGGIL